MDVYNNDEYLYEDEIDLRELILVLWDKKVRIIVFALIVAIITALISIFALTPVYHSQMKIVMNMPGSYNTKYGDYALPITTNQEYINLLTSNDVLVGTIKDMGYDEEEVTVADLRKRISIKIDKDKASQNVYDVEVSSSDPEDARRLAETLYRNYTQFVNVITIEGALDSYINIYNIQLENQRISLQTHVYLLEKNEELLAETPATINQKAALEEVENQGSINDFLVLENIINPNYTEIENDIVENRQSINSLENSIEINKEKLEELYIIKDLIADYYENDSYEELSSNIVEITAGSITMPSAPIAPSQKTGPSNTKNVILATVLAGMVAVIVVLFQWWWNDVEYE